MPVERVMSQHLLQHSAGQASHPATHICSAAGKMRPGHQAARRSLLHQGGQHPPQCIFVHHHVHQRAPSAPL